MKESSILIVMTRETKEPKGESFSVGARNPSRTMVDERKWCTNLRRVEANEAYAILERIEMTVSNV